MVPPFFGSAVSTALAVTWVGIVAPAWLLSACGDDAPDPSNNETPAEMSSPTPASTPSETLPALKIIGTTPADGAMAVPRGTSFEVLFNQPLTVDPELIHLQLTDPDGMTTSLEDPVLSEDGKTVTCYGIGLDKDADYRLEVELDQAEAQQPQPAAWPLTAGASFTTRYPCGVSFNIVIDVAVVQLGGNPKLAETLNGILASSVLTPVGLMDVDVYTGTAFPAAGFKIVSGLAYKSKEEGQEGLYTLDDDYGFPVSMTDCDISDTGFFSCGPQAFVFPIPVTDETVVNLYLSDAVISGDMTASGSISTLQNFMLEGVITEEDIDRIAYETGLPFLSDLVTLDVDTNGDGVADSATGIATSQPQWIEFTFCDPATGGARE